MDGTPFNTTGGIHEVPAGTPGRMYLCGKHHIGPDVHAVLAYTNNAHVVCLVEPHELEHRYDEYAGWLRENAGAGATWSPIHDMHALPATDALELFTQLAGLLRNGTNVVIHCAAGIGRAGTTAAGTLMVLGMHSAEALDHVRSHRPMAGPQTQVQQDLLDELEVRLHGGRGPSD